MSKHFYIDTTRYNQLLRIEEELADAARYAGTAAFPRFAAGK